MTPPRLLVIEGNLPADSARHLAVGGIKAGEGYAALLKRLRSDAHVDIVAPAADGFSAHPALTTDYDGAVITGSSLHIYHHSPEIRRQIELVRALLDAGIPIFGSCWGLQVLTTVCGGNVRRNPKGRELGIGRNIQLTAAGRTHAMYAHKPDVFSAMTVHLDEVETLPSCATLLATNAFSRVQGVEFRLPRTTAWGVQYHPEYPLRELAAIMRRIDSLVIEGFFPDEAGRAEYIQAFDALDRDPANRALAWRLGVDETILDHAIQTSEIAQWMACCVEPKLRMRHSAN